MQKLLLAVDSLSTWFGKACAWTVIGLTLLITWEVFSRYVLNNPHAWVLDAQIMLYGVLFMSAGAYGAPPPGPRSPGPGRGVRGGPATPDLRGHADAGARAALAIDCDRDVRPHLPATWSPRVRSKAVGEPSGLRILHVDDVEINVMVLDQMLSMLGHSPVGATSGAEAFALMEASSFDLVLTDFHMPDVTGLDFLKNVKALREPARLTPVVVVTADVMSFTNAALREMGFAGALAKPITAASLVQVIAAATAGTGQFLGNGFARS
eukprot:gene15228-32260_t